MYKKTIISLLLFLTPIGIIEQNKKDRSPQIFNYEYNLKEKNNLHLIDNLFEANEKKYITIKNCREEDLLSQKRYCSFRKKIFS